MRKTLAVVLMLGLAAAYAADEKPEAKKSSKAKPAAKAEKKSEKNAAQKTDAAVMNWVNDNKIWIQKK